MEKRIVAYIDLLGLKKLIDLFTYGDLNEAEKQVKKIEEILSIFKKSADRTRDIGTEIKIFSDNICISEIYSPQDKFVADNIFSLCYNLMLSQFELAMMGYFLRGGIAIGYHYSSAITILGNALANAYYIESKKSIAPRILTHHTFWSGIEEISAIYGEQKVETIKKLFLKDIDGEYFIDYLETWYELDASLDEILMDHKEILTQAIQKNLGDIEILNKVHWLAAYHNRKVSELIDKNKKKFKIPISKLLPSCTKNPIRKI